MLCRKKKSKKLKKKSSRLSQRKLKLSKIILGIDEVGRGPWAGPLVLGAVILGENPGAWTADLTDSKKLTAKKRETLNQLILENAPATGLGWVKSDEIDRYGLSNSLKLGARRAVKEVLKSDTPFDEITIDGTINFLAGTPLEDKVTILKKADFLIKEVSAASIIAKVARDHYMIELAKKYPAYHFEKHVGYGTAAHKEALLAHGVCPEHRRSFRPIREMIQQHEDNIIYDQPEKSEINLFCTTATGQTAENLIIQLLESKDHSIVAHNYKTKTYEIDIISTFDDKIYFTEVKYREKSTHGTSLDQISPQKLAKMQLAADAFLADHTEFAKFQPTLAAGLVSGADFHVDDWFEIY